MKLLGKEIRLAGVSQRGKNRIREHGELWLVLAETEHVLFNPGPGPWIFIAPHGKTMNDKASRWIHLNDDIDFKIKND